MDSRFRAVLFVFTIIMLAALAGCQTSHPQPAVAMGDGVFIHITAGPEDPHRALMGLQMAQMMSENHDVLVYCDLQGVNLLSKSSMDVIHSSFPSSHTQIQLLLGKGVPILACPGCLKAAGLRSGDLREGVEVARKDAFFNFTQGRILSLDY